MFRFCLTGGLLAALVLSTGCESNNAGRGARAPSPNAEFKAPATGICGAERNRAEFAFGPDRLPALSEVQRRGGLSLVSEQSGNVAIRHADDGSVDDWLGKAPSIGGLAVYDQGEHIYSDFIYDAWGADDGQDVSRYSVNEGLQQVYPRAERIDQLFQALGDQFGAPAPVGASSHYGDATDIRGANDITELRWALSENGVAFYGRLSRFVDGDKPVFVVLLDLNETRADVPLLGLTDTRYDRLLLLQTNQVDVVDLVTGEALPASTVLTQWLSQDFVNAVEAEIPWQLLGGDRDELTLTVLTAAGSDTDADGVFDAFTPANLGYRYDALDGGNTIVPCDPVAGIYNERAQAFDLYNGNIDGYAIELDVAGMRQGRSQSVQLTGGYFERHFKSDPSISHEDPIALGIEDSSDPFEPYEQTQDQAYGLYLPQGYDPQAEYPLTFWLHYQGGMTHSAGAWSPRIVHQHGEDNGSIVVTPRARGSKSWYVGASHQDIWEVFADVAGTNVTKATGLSAKHSFGQQGVAKVNKNRIYLSGYSMGGYGTYMFGLMYPDFFAAAYSTSGVHFGSALPGGTHLLENARHLPIVIHHGLIDELVPWISIEPVALTLAQLGYRHRMDTFPAYEHYTHAITDEWAEGTRYLAQFERTENPRTVTYKRAPELIRTINNNRSTMYGAGERTTFSFNPDGAWWVDDIRLRDSAGCDIFGQSACDGSVTGLVEAVSFALPELDHSAVPPVLDMDNGLGLPSTPVLSIGNSLSPYVRQGLDWQEGGEKALDNRFTADLTNVGHVTLDVAAMALDLSAGATGAINTDGSVKVGFKNIADNTQVLVNNEPAGEFQNNVLWIELDAGAHQLTLTR